MLLNEPREFVILERSSIEMTGPQLERVYIERHYIISAYVPKYLNCSPHS